MTTQTSSQTAEYEETLTNIVRTLPPERAAQLVDFARFLEAQALLEELAEAESAAWKRVPRARSVGRRHDYLILDRQANDYECLLKGM